MRKKVIKFLKEIKWEVTYTALARYINSRGFTLISLHTPIGDTILKSLGMYEKCLSCDGRTYRRTEINLVVINEKLSNADKLRVLLHEIYHVDNHNTNNIINDTTDVQRENEAETFAYEVFRLQKYKFLYNRFVQSIAVCVLIIITALAGIQLSYGAAKPQQSIRAETYATETPVASASPAEELQINAEANVYTLPGSEVYHKDTCYHLNINNASALTTPEAEKLGLRPCKDCDPE